MNTPNSREALESLAARLKGRAVPGTEDTPVPAQAPAASPPEALFPLSASMPETEAMKRLHDVERQLQTAFATIVSEKAVNEELRTELVTANARIATLLQERNLGVESIIDTLREFQIGGLANGPTPQIASTLSDVFGKQSKLNERIKEAGFSAQAATWRDRWACLACEFRSAVALCPHRWSPFRQFSGPCAQLDPP